MKLWLLEPVDEDPFGYDCAHGFVIRAKTEEQARQLAHENGGDESRPRGGKPWLDPKYTSCVLLTAKGDAGVVLEDYQAS